MAKKASGKSETKSGAKRARKSSSKPSTAVARVSSAGRGNGSEKQESGFDAGEAFIKLLQSPLVAELVAVAATAALAALAEQGFSTTGTTTSGKRAGKAVKAAGKAAAAAVGRRLSTEIDEIRKAAKDAVKA
jgi:hypothetical protein